MTESLTLLKAGSVSSGMLGRRCKEEPAFVLGQACRKHPCPCVKQPHTCTLTHTHTHLWQLCCDLLPPSNGVQQLIHLHIVQVLVPAGFYEARDIHLQDFSKCHPVADDAISWNRIYYSCRNSFPGISMKLFFGLPVVLA